MSYFNIIQSGKPFVAALELVNPPFNYVNTELLREYADLLDAFDQDPQVRSVVLTSQGRVFCAGANFNAGPDDQDVRDPGQLYAQAMRLFRTKKPVVAAVQGAAVGAGLGLALSADFRVTCSEARFSANFNRLGFHPGFGLSVTLPRLVGVQLASMLMYTGKRITGDHAHSMGLADVLVEQDKVVEAAIVLAGEIAQSAPLAVQATRTTLRQGLADEVQLVNAHERSVQLVHYATQDFKEGVAAMAERRTPEFIGS